MKVVALLLMFFLPGAACSGFSITGDSLKMLLPSAQEIAPWRQADSLRIVAGDQLFELIDGGADVYLEYGFKQAISVRYKDDNEHSVSLEIYEMNDTAAAFGIYSFNSSMSGKPVNAGNEGKAYDDYLQFWKDRYFISLAGSDTALLTRHAIQVIAESVDKKIPGKGDPPALLQCLPAEDLQQNKFFKGLLGLSSIYVFDTQNIFGFKEGIAGNYSGNLIFVLSYEDELSERRHYFTARDDFRKNARFSGFKKEQEGFSVIDRNKQKIRVIPYRRFIVVLLGKHAKGAKEEIQKSLDLFLSGIETQRHE